MLDEKLSALMDDELDSSELNACLEKLNNDAEARQAWSRQHLLRAVLNEQATKTDSCFSERVMSVLESSGHENDVSANQNVINFPRNKWRSNRWMGGLAVAASVAAVAMFVPYSLENQRSTEGGTVAVLDSTQRTTSVALKQRSQATAEARRELQQYLLNHEALVSGHGLNGQRGYMRMASPSTTYVAYSPE